MFNVGITELLVFAIITLLILGPDKLPEAIRFASRWYSKTKRFIGNIQDDIDRELRVSELKDQMQKEMQRITELEQKMQMQLKSMESLDVPKNQLAQSLSKTCHQLTPIQQIHFGYSLDYPFLVTNTASNTAELPQLKVAV
ncbi:Sec-independent protein translocase protein TatB [Acinetobacter apis]|uniref:Sec-independent protein translocase protein TatB n=1 Tax=Acinetobacter apis TaxID=1229165 RepID=A0A217EFQ5_9GAMM|nr:Sec-independent protein translocase protein TatB [Acinetobacter apis]SNQ29329.1 sec-independent protein translocase protein TatB [Acinetobacter apis]